MIRFLSPALRSLKSNVNYVKRKMTMKSIKKREKNAQTLRHNQIREFYSLKALKTISNARVEFLDLFRIACCACVWLHFYSQNMEGRQQIPLPLCKSERNNNKKRAHITSNNKFSVFDSYIPTETVNEVNS